MLSWIVIDRTLVSALSDIRMSVYYLKRALTSLGLDMRVFGPSREGCQVWHTERSTDKFKNNVPSKGGHQVRSASPSS